MTLRVILTTIVSVITGVILMEVSDYFSASRDYAEEATVGVITRYGWPLHNMKGAPGWSWNQFNDGAYALDFGVFFLLAAALCAAVQYLVCKDKLAAQALAQRFRRAK